MEHLPPLPQSLIELHPNVWRNAALAGYRGSLAHGLHIPPEEEMGTDDVDVMALCVPDPSHYFGLKDFGSRGTVEIKQDEWDVVAYESRKFISLLARGNPNILGMVWLEPKYYLMTARAGEYLLSCRMAFSTQVAYHSFIGYAHAQLDAVEKNVYEGYMGQKRKGLLERFGYDVKHAAHCIRLLRMGIEFLADGVLRVDRSTIDREELIAIKRGEWSLDAVKKEAWRGFELAREAVGRSTLPDKPDYKQINEICCEVVRLAWEDRGIWKNP
jgi:hypothetical protein